MENLDVKNRAIGFFDSGVGGLSVLGEAVKLLPQEDFIYFGDSKNAPYGTKKVDDVKELTFKAVEYLIDKKVKAIVIACNTATSAAINDLRERYKFIPIIGIEPALKPAVELRRKGSVVIMATPMTLAEDKFNNLMKSYSNEAEIAPLPCAGLAELIEDGKVKGEEVYTYLKEKLLPFQKNGIASVVLGCTHYPFVKNELMKVLGIDIPVIDGSYGTAKQLERLLTKDNILNDKSEKGRVEIFNSLNSEKIIELSYKLLNQEIS